MRRTGFIVLLLVLGAATNVAVAWLIVALDWTVGSTITIGEVDPVWPPDSTRDPYELRWSSAPCTQRLDVQGLNLQFLPAPDLRPSNAPAWATAPVNLSATSARRFIVYEIGLPLRSLGASMEVKPGFIPVVGQLGCACPNDGGFRLPALRPRPRPAFYPSRVLTAPFAVNSAAYAGVWLLLCLAPGATRGALRRRSGLCPRCAYDLHADFASGCPECGWKRPRAAPGASA